MGGRESDEENGTGWTVYIQTADVSVKTNKAGCHACDTGSDAQCFIWALIEVTL